jgi:Head domain of trimeric autotransporter adhesin
VTLQNGLQISSGNLSVASTTPSTSSSTGALTVAGGLGVAGDSTVGGKLNITSTTPSTSAATGALTIAGGLGVAGNSTLGGNLTVNGDNMKLGGTGVNSGVTTTLAMGGVTNGGVASLNGALTIQNDSGGTQQVIFAGNGANTSGSPNARWMFGTYKTVGSPIFTPQMTVDDNGMVLGDTANIGSTSSNLTMGGFLKMNGAYVGTGSNLSGVPSIRLFKHYVNSGSPGTPTVGISINPGDDSPLPASILIDNSPVLTAASSSATLATQGFVRTVSGNTAVTGNITASGSIKGGSIAIGSGVTASGTNSAVFGTSCYASGNNSFAQGYNTNASGEYSIAMGGGASAGGYGAVSFWGNASGYRSFAFGGSGTGGGAQGDYSISLGGGGATGTYSVSIGVGVSTSAYSVAMGSGNVGGGDALNWVATDPLFEIGNKAPSATVNSNALTVYKNGQVTLSAVQGDVSPGVYQ